MPIKKLKLEKLNITAGTDVRNEISETIVDEYSEAARLKAKFPPLVVFDCNGDGMVLADGFHRYFAFERQGVKEYDCDIRKGTKTDALKFALGSNTTHGYRRTNADKRSAVIIALKEFSKLSSRAISDLCVVHRSTVDEIRTEMDQITEREKLESPEPQVAESATSPSEKPSKSQIPARREGKDGKSYSIPARPEAEPKKPETMDATGIEVPEELVAYWDSTFDESNRLLTMVSEVRVRIKRAQDTNEPAFREVNHTDVIAKLDQVYADLKCAKPYAVCADCNGIKTKGCTGCKGRGFVSDFWWNKFVPEETKKTTGRS